MKKTVQTRRGMAPAGRPALDRAVRLVVGRQERAHLGVGGEAIAQELDGTRLREQSRESRRWVDGVGRR